MIFREKLNKLSVLNTQIITNSNQINMEKFIKILLIRFEIEILS